MNPVTKRSIVATVGALTTLAVAAVQVSASGSAPPAGLNSISINFAGYAAPAPAPYVTAAATFNVPATACNGTAYAMFPAVQLFSNATFALGGLELSCHSGSPAYIPYIEIGGVITTSSTQGNPGDSIKVTVIVNGLSSRVIVDDLTNKKSFVKTGAGMAVTGVAVGDFGNYTTGGVLQGVPTFSSITFNGVRVGAFTLSALHPGAYNRVKGSTLQIKTGAFNSAGTAFKTLFKHG